MSQAAPWRTSTDGRVRGLRARAATTPGRVRLLSVLLVAGAGLLWMLGVASVTTARAEVDGVAGHAVPVIIDAERTHALLSDADRLAANDFLLGATGSTEQRQEYELDISMATRNLESAAELNGPGGPASERLQQITAMLAQYTGLVETARTNARAGFPVGASFLRQASDLMHRPRNGILAMLDGMDTFGGDDPTADNATHLLWALVLGAYFAVVVLVLGLLVSTQVYLRRRFRRRRSYQLLLATVLLLGSAGWMGYQSVVTERSLRAAETDTFPKLHSLWLMKALVADANADQSLALISRGSTTAYDDAFNAAIRQLVDRPLDDETADAAARGDVRFKGLLADEIAETDTPGERADAIQVLRGYQAFMALDRDIRDRVKAGGYDDAVSRVVGGNQLGTAYADLGRGLDRRIDTEQVQFDQAVARSRPGAAIEPGVAAIAIVMVGLVLWALLPRLREYTM